MIAAKTLGLAAAVVAIASPGVALSAEKLSFVLPGPVQPVAIQPPPER